MGKLAKWPARTVENVYHKAGESAAVCHDCQLQFAPQRVAGQDAEVAADVREHGADRPATHLGGDLLRRGQPREQRISRLGRARRSRLAFGSETGQARRPRFLVQRGGVLKHAGLERVGAQQTARDAGEDLRDIVGAEADGSEGGVGRGALADRGGEFRGVVDQPANESEQAAAARGLVRIGRIGLSCGRGGRIGREQKKDTRPG
jgi:hypothetical protein